jgi:hypothetical protein
MRTWTAVPEPIVEFLEKLYNTDRRGGSLLKTDVNSYPGGKVKWIADRTKIIQDRCQEILKQTIGQCPSSASFIFASLASCMIPLPETPISSETSYLNAPELEPESSAANSSDESPSPQPQDTTRALFPETPATGIKQTREQAGIKRTREQAGMGRTLTPVRTLGAFKKGRRRTRKAKSRNRRTRRKKFTA